MSFTWKCGDTYHTVARHGCGCNAVNREGKTLAKQSMKVVLRGCRKVDGRVDIDEGPHRLVRDALRLRLTIKRGFHPDSERPLQTNTLSTFYRMFLHALDAIRSMLL